ncbi:HEPN domain-containing protein [Shewanella sp. HL-SH8]|uniref:HEPN domain-containing protein n=1 Tax=Shewanella sp. HL-SH8 TaxID=3436242 RepID=UPI003EBAAAC4
MVQQHLIEVIKPSSTSSKEFNYKSSIIALYGYLESYLEKLAEEFINCINESKIPVLKLPNSIRERHLELSIKFLDKIAKNKNQKDSDKRKCEIDVISNLHSFLHAKDDYLLNSKAFSIHGANFRYELIQSYFAQIGVTNIADRTLGFEEVTFQLANRLGQEPSQEKLIMKGWLESELGELAQLRNEIAHGSFERNFEQFELIISRAEFLKHFGNALAEILHRSFDECLYHGTERKVIGSADKTFPAHSCFGFFGKPINGTEEKFKIKVGDNIYAKNDKMVTIGKIESLIQDNISITEINYPSETDFSIKVDFTISNGMLNRELSIKNYI